jgi:predicted transcriptional regulator
MSKFDCVHDADDFEEDTEPTPITDMGEAFRRISTINRSVNRLLKQTGSVKKSVEEACSDAQGARRAANEALQHSEILRSRQEDFAKHLTAVDQAVEKWTGLNHQIDKSVTVLGSVVDQLGVETSTIRNGRAKTTAMVVSIALTIGLAISAWSWSLSGDLSATQADLRGESALRAAQISALEARLEGLPRRTDIEQIQLAVDQGRGYEKVPSHVLVCEGMTNAQKATLRAQVASGRLPRAFSCDL